MNSLIRLMDSTIVAQNPIGRVAKASPVHSIGARIVDWTCACSTFADSPFFAFDDLRWHVTARLQRIA